MAGQGKYTKFVPQADPKYDRLGKLFAGAGDTTNPYADFMVSGDAEGCRIALLDGTAGFANNLNQGARDMLQPSKPISDAVVVQEFGAPVDLNYVGDPNNISIPNTAEGIDVVWQKAGDPVNPFAPDLRSPGPHLTEATANSNMGVAPDPVVATVDSLKPGYVVGAPGTGTASPTATTAPLRSITSLGRSVPLGTSDESKPFE